MKGFAIHATDGELGKADQFYFDDETWAIRYLTVETGGWLGGRRVLISPMSITHVDWEAEHVHVSLTRKQVEDSPDINTHQPISRQHEVKYLSYYGYSNYWSGPYLWGQMAYPMGMAFPMTDAAAKGFTGPKAETMDSHLRSTHAVTDYHIDAIDGEIGHVVGFLMDDEAWAIRYIEVATRNWWPGKKVLVSPDWIERISWVSSQVDVALTRERIQTAPEYVETEPVTREFENRLYFHYGRPPYWIHQGKESTSHALIGA
jgi:hypothetical protein